MSGEEGPLLDRVRRCSSQPEAAVAFFREMLSPCSECRPGAEAVLHPYIKPHTLQMIRELGRGCKHTCMPLSFASCQGTP